MSTFLIGKAEYVPLGPAGLPVWLGHHKTKTR
jgi:hypothetical protein